MNEHLLFFAYAAACAGIPGFVIAAIGLAAGIAHIITLRRAKVSL